MQPERIVASCQEIDEASQKLKRQIENESSSAKKSLSEARLRQTNEQNHRGKEIDFILKIFEDERQKFLEGSQSRKIAALLSSEKHEALANEKLIYQKSLQSAFLKEKEQSEIRLAIAREEIKDEVRKESLNFKELEQNLVSSAKSQFLEVEKSEIEKFRVESLQIIDIESQRRLEKNYLQEEHNSKIRLRRARKMEAKKLQRYEQLLRQKEDAIAAKRLTERLVIEQNRSDKRLESMKESLRKASDNQLASLKRSEQERAKIRCDELEAREKVQIEFYREELRKEREIELDRYRNQLAEVESEMVRKQDLGRPAFKAKILGEHQKMLNNTFAELDQKHRFDSKRLDDRLDCEISEYRSQLDKDLEQKILERKKTLEEKLAGESDIYESRLCKLKHLEDEKTRKKLEELEAAEKNQIEDFKRDLRKKQEIELNQYSEELRKKEEGFALEFKERRATSESQIHDEFNKILEGRFAEVDKRHQAELKNISIKFENDIASFRRRSEEDNQQKILAYKEESEKKLANELSARQLEFKVELEKEEERSKQRLLEAFEEQENLALENHQDQLTIEKIEAEERLRIALEKEREIIANYVAELQFQEDLASKKRLDERLEKERLKSEMRLKSGLRRGERVINSELQGRINREQNVIDHWRDKIELHEQNARHDQGNLQTVASIRRPTIGVDTRRSENDHYNRILAAMPQNILQKALLSSSVSEVVKVLRECNDQNRALILQSLPERSRGHVVCAIGSVKSSQALYLSQFTNRMQLEKDGR